MSARSRSGRAFDAALLSAVAAACYDIAVIGWLLSKDRPMPSLVWIVAFLWAVLSFGLAATIGRWGTPVVTPTVAYSRIIVVALGVLGVLLIVTILVLMQLIPDPVLPPGEALIENGRYIVDNHGSQTVISESVYNQSRVSDESGSTAVALVFSLVTAFSIAASGEKIAAKQRRPDRAAQR